jgi:hypothetical protein
MKKLILLFLFISQASFGQYKASNGVTYSVGDTLTIGRGTANNGSFLYIQMSGVVSAGAERDELNMDRQYSGLKAVVRKVIQKKIAGQLKAFLSIKMGPLIYNVDIEQALDTGEIKQ